MEPRRRTSQKTTERPLWQEILWLIPKNLVYVFVIVIVFAFAAMMYITYTDRNMTEFLAYDRTREVVVVDPLFSSLQASIGLTKQAAVSSIQSHLLDPSAFHSSFLRNN